MIELSTEKKTLWVIVLTLITMVAEIAVGYFSHSMALFADGWHMGTHALALSLTFFTYIFIRKLANSPSFVFGTGKFSALSGYTSSIILGITGAYIIKEGIERIFNPFTIGLNEAITVAIIGFVVNLFCIIIMSEKNDSHHCHKHDEDYNFKAAYLHITADLMTSVFAICALFAAKYASWNLLDPIAGIIGGFIICIWAFNLIRSTSMILLDTEAVDIKNKIYTKLGDKIKIKELHVWQTSENEFALVGKISGDYSLSEFKSEISDIGNFKFINIEFNNE